MKRTLPLPTLVRQTKACMLGKEKATPKVADINYYNDPALAACGVVVAFTERNGGVSNSPYRSLNAATHVGDNPADVSLNRELILEATGAAGLLEALVVPVQTHSDHISVVAADANSDQFADTDALITNEPRKPLLLCFADCLPLVLVAPPSTHTSQPTIAVVHAGWRGALAGIHLKALKHLTHAANCAPSQVNAYIGAHIRDCCFEVSAEVIDQFTQAYGTSCKRDNAHLSLGCAITTSLCDAGVAPKRIAEIPACTVCDTEHFFSYRAEGPTTGRHAALAFIA